MKTLKEQLIKESVTINGDYDFDNEYKGNDKCKPIEIKLKFNPIVEYCYFIDDDENVMDWINSDDEPDKTVGSKGTFYFKCKFIPENKGKHTHDIKIWAIIETNVRGDIIDFKINRSGIDDYSPISFDNLADLLYNVSDEYAIGYFEDKDAIISAFNDCDLYR